MNLSGDAVAPFVKKHHLDPAELLVVVDDLDLPLGHLRIRAKGSSGGHNGLKSVIAALGTEQFARLRLGISRPPEGTSVLEWVLSRFAWEERRLVAGVLERAVKAVEVAIADGIEIAMTQFNG
jgi:PTH1 family peptidyl-tRNA hydrolase